MKWIDGIDYAFDASRRSLFAAAIRRYYPALDESRLQPAYRESGRRFPGPGEAAADYDPGAGVHGLAGLVNSRHRIAGLTARSPSPMRWLRRWRRCQLPSHSTKSPQTVAAGAAVARPQVGLYVANRRQAIHRSGADVPRTQQTAAAGIHSMRFTLAHRIQLWLRSSWPPARCPQHMPVTATASRAAR